VKIDFFFYDKPTMNCYENIEILCDALRKIIRIFRKDVGHIVLDYICNANCDNCHKYIDFENDNIYINASSHYAIFLWCHQNVAFGLHVEFYHYECKITNAIICFQCKMTNLRHGFTSCYYLSGGIYCYNDNTCCSKVCKHIEISAKRIKTLTEKNIFCHVCQNDLDDMKRMCKRVINHSDVVNNIKQCWGCELHFCEHVMIKKYCIKCFLFYTGKYKCNRAHGDYCGCKIYCLQAKCSSCGSYNVSLEIYPSFKLFCDHSYSVHLPIRKEHCKCKYCDYLKFLNLRGYIVVE